MSTVAFVVSRVYSCGGNDYTISVYEDAGGYFPLWDCPQCHSPGTVPEGRYKDREIAITDCQKAIDRHHAEKHSESPCALETVIVTAELDRRAKRWKDSNAESSALLSLTCSLAESPKNFFDQLVKKALELSGAGSTGISLLNHEKGRFVWPAVAGQLKSYLGSGTPSDFGPCGTVLDRNSALLFSRPDRHFTYLAPIAPPLEEVLLIPFYMNDKAVGTIWAVSHDKNKQFDAEDRRLLVSLSTFASSAYQVLENLGALEPLLKVRAE